MLTWYDLDCENVIAAVGGAWNAFAKAGGAPHLVTSRIVGGSLWDHVTGDATCAYLDSVLHLCRESGETFSHLYRCDAPATARLFRMTVAPSKRGGSGGLRVAHRLLRGARMEGPPRVIRLDEAANANRCSLCGAIELGGEWRDTFARPDPRWFVRSYTLCPTCRAPETAHPERDFERVVALHGWRKAG